MISCLLSSDVAPAQDFISSYQITNSEVYFAGERITITDAACLDLDADLPHVRLWNV